MDQAPAPDGLPPSLRFLKWLVILLTLTMIGGVITVVAVLVTRIPDTFGQVAPPALPAALTLPPGVTAGAVTFGAGWIAVVGQGADGAERILIYAPDGRLRQDVPLLPAP
ncbi:MAG: DUF6476 family protein [Gemmobacter sp.]